MLVPDIPRMTAQGADAAGRRPRTTFHRGNAGVVSKRAVSMGVVASLLCSTLTAISAPAQRASAAPAPATAAALPAGGLVPSVSGYGKTAGSFSVSNDGSAQYRVPLWTPDGRGQAKPALSLSYDSRAGNGLIGVGWSLAGLSSIAPCAKTIAQDGYTDGVSFDASDAFCLGAARLLPVTPLPPPPAQLQEREYRTEQESFTRVIGYGMVNNLPTFFKAWTKDGKILTFGQSPDARRQAFRLAAGGESNTLVREPTTRVTLAWDVNRIEDRNGNAATVEYERVEGTADQLWHVESRPKTIRYAPDREVQFSYEDRTDPIESYGRGVHTREPKRLMMVSMRRSQPGGTGELLREYRIGYQNTSITKRSLVTSITECDGPACKQPITFAWSLGSYATQPIDTTIGDGGQYRPLGGEPPQGNDVDNQIVVGDFDGDSRDDILYPNTDDWLHDVDQVDDPQKQSIQQKWFLRLSTGSGFGPAKPAGFAPPVHHCISPPPGRRGIECTASKGRVHPIDVDLDGRLEVLVWVPVSATRSRWRLYTFNGTTFVPHSSKLEGREETDNFPDPAYFADLDGNGTPDFITAPEDHHAWDSFAELSEIDGPWTYRLNTAEPGTARFASPVNTLQRVPSRPAAQVVDANADGRADLIGSDALGWGLHGSGAVQSRRYAGAVSTPETPRRSVADLNGDGLEDAVSPYTIWRDDLPQAPKGSLVAALSSGNGVGPFSTSPNNYWEPEWRRVPAPPPGGEPGQIDWGYNRGVQYVDFNADGADDVLIFRGGKPSSTDPTRFGAQLYVWRDGGLEWAPLNREAGSRGPGGFTASRTLDIDGDGMLDILHVQDDPDAGAGQPKGHLRILKHAGGMPDRVIGIGGPTRDRIEVDYTSLADRDVHIPGTSCTYPQICLTHGGSVVAAHRTWTYASSGGAPGWDQHNHLYLAGKQDVLGRGWLGFGSHIVTRALTGAQTITQFDNTTRDEAIDAYPFANLPNRVTSTIKDSPTGREHQTVVVTQYGVRRHPGGGYSVEPRQVDATAQERPVGGGAWQLLRQTAVTTAFDDYGNAALTTTQTAGGRMVVQDPIYRNDTTAWLLGLPTRQQTRACTAANVACVTRTSTFDYDANGNQILAVTEPNKPDMKLSTTSVYDQYGNLTAVTRTDAANHARTERFEYIDADKVYPTATINSLGHKSLIETHSGLGVPLRITDPNGVATTMKYDRFGRPRATYHADGSFDEITHSRQGVWDLTTTTTAGGGQTSVLTDQLDREIQNAVKAFDGRLATTYTRYDPLGRPRDVSRPNFADETLRFTTTGYDNRDRPVSVAAPDGVTVRHTYANRESHTYDGKNVHSSYTVTNVDGEVVSSFQNDPKSTGWLSTRYEYGPFGEATRAVAPDDTQQVMTYDSLGRRTRLVDPSTGTTTTGYNAFGEIVTETDGNGRTTTLEHDVAGRVTTSTSPDGAATNVWDTALHGKGLLAKATSSDGVVTVSTYDEHSKPETATWTVDGANYQIGYAYDQFGRQAQLTYPAIPGANGRLKVNYAYNPAGYLHQVRDPAAGGTVYWTAEDRNSAGQLVWERLGDGATSTLDHRVFDPATGLLKGITVTGPGGLDEDTTYGYDNNRNVTARAAAGRTETHAYDTLNRLTSWKLTAAGVTSTTTFDYDEVGNLKTETVSARPERNVTYTYGDGAPPHALTARNGVRYGYDAAGRQTTGDGRTITYNQIGLPKSLIWGQNQRTDLAYDAAGARVLKRDGNYTQITVGGLFERRNPAGTGSNEIHNLHNIIVDGGVVAQVNRAQSIAGGPTSEPTIAYLHTDLQNSTTLVTNKAGRPIDNEETWLREIFYDPFGRRTQADGTPLGDQRRGGPHQGYTSHEHDDELGLINMKGRIYDPDQRRFLTPDTLVPDPFNGQDYNRYAYVNNNPATATDPTGHAGLIAEMRQNSSYEELQGTDRTIAMDIDELSDGRRWGLTQDEKWAQSDGLKYVGNGGPEQLNAAPVATTRSDGDNSSRNNTSSAEFEEEEEVDIDGGGANDLDGNGADDDYEEPDADSGNPAAVAAPAGILGWFNKLVNRGKVSRAIGKVIETGVHIDDEGKIGSSMKPVRGEYVMQTEREALQRAADLENAPARTGVKRSGGTKLGARGGGVFLWLMIIDAGAQAIYETDWATERRARSNNVSIEKQRENEKCAAGLCS